MLLIIVQIPGNFLNTTLAVNELRSAFHTWQTKHTIEWFTAHGVPLHAEADGRMFPVTNHSQSIIDCLLERVQCTGIRRLCNQNLRHIEALANGGFRLHWSQGASQISDRVLLACGSLKTNSELCNSIQALGHSIEPLAPSLFAFALKDARLSDLAGLSVPMATVKLLPKGSKTIGPLADYTPRTQWTFNPSLVCLGSARFTSMSVSIQDIY